MTGKKTKDCDRSLAINPMAEYHVASIICVEEECHTIPEWALINDLSEYMIWDRLRKGWDPVKAVTEKPYEAASRRSLALIAEAFEPVYSVEGVGDERSPQEGLQEPKD